MAAALVHAHVRLLALPYPSTGHAASLLQGGYGGAPGGYAGYGGGYQNQNAAAPNGGGGYGGGGGGGGWQQAPQAGPGAYPGYTGNW